MAEPSNITNPTPSINPGGNEEISGTDGSVASQNSTVQGVQPINQETPPTANTTPIIQTEFLKGTETSEKDALYNDIFQSNQNNGKVKVKRSKLEIGTKIASFIVPIIVIGSIIGGGYAFLKSQTDNTFAENYPFLCGFLNSGIDTKEEKGCKTATILKDEYEEKTKKLQGDIVNELSVYIPIKVSSNAVAASAENTFITKTYNSKINLNTIIEQFEKIRNSSQSKDFDNIECANINITQGNLLTVRCNIFGGDIGENDTDGKLGSSRIEASRFLRRLANTAESSFTLETPPTLLNTDDLTKYDTIINPNYKTQTVASFSLRYIPFTPQL